MSKERVKERKIVVEILIHEYEEGQATIEEVEVDGAFRAQHEGPANFGGDQWIIFEEENGLIIGLEGVYP